MTSSRPGWFPRLQRLHLPLQHLKSALNAAPFPENLALAPARYSVDSARPWRCRRVRWSLPRSPINRIRDLDLSLGGNFAGLCRVGASVRCLCLGCCRTMRHRQLRLSSVNESIRTGSSCLTRREGPETRSKLVTMASVATVGSHGRS
jgi:hypothetical protein